MSKYKSEYLEHVTELEETTEYPIGQLTDGHIIGRKMFTKSFNPLPLLSNYWTAGRTD